VYALEIKGEQKNSEMKSKQRKPAQFAGQNQLEI
jgi:hypothetical protein